MSLSAGNIYRVRYDTNTTSSTQKKGERRIVMPIEVVQGPHTDMRFRKGEVVTVKDLSDPNHPGKASQQ